MPGDKPINSALFDDVLRGIPAESYRDRADREAQHAFNAIFNAPYSAMQEFEKNYGPLTIDQKKIILEHVASNLGVEASIQVKGAKSDRARTE